MNTKQNIFLNTMGYTDFFPKDGLYVGSSPLYCSSPKLVVFVLRLSDPSLVPASSCDRGAPQGEAGDGGELLGDVAVFRTSPKAHVPTP